MTDSQTGWRCRMTDRLTELRDKWTRLHPKRLAEGDGDGSLFGAAYIIARSACSDIPALLDVAEAARRHRPQTIDVYKYRCANGDCEHDECPVTQTAVCAECFDLWTQDGARTEDFDERLLWERCAIGAALARLDGGSSD